MIFSEYKDINYVYDKQLLKLVFSDNPKYNEYLQDVKDIKRIRFVVELDDISNFFDNNELCFRIEQNPLRYKKFIIEICDERLKEIKRSRKIEVMDIITHYENVIENSMVDENEKLNIPNGICRR